MVTHGHLLKLCSSLELRPGEHLIDSMANVEDTKGNSGEGGTLVVTNLRLMWISSRYSKTNLSKFHASERTLTLQQP